MRLAKGIKQNLTTGYIQEYLQLYQYNMQGVVIQVGNAPTSNATTFSLKLNGVVIVPDTSLIIGVSQTSINIPYTTVLYQNDVLTFTCTSCLDSGVGDPIFFGIY